MSQLPPEQSGPDAIFSPPGSDLNLTVDNLDNSSISISFFKLRPKDRPRADYPLILMVLSVTIRAQGVSKPLPASPEPA